VQEEIKPDSSDIRSKKSQVSSMFDTIAPWYDFLNHFLSLGIDITWRQKTIKYLKAQHGQMILDVASGTGDLAIEAFRQLKPQQIIGLDISNEMLEIGRQKVAKKNLDGTIVLIQGDSENMPFSNNTFDIITVAFGVRNFENLEKGLIEMFRVLKPNGEVAILEFSRPTLFPFKQLYNFYFKNLLPLIGRFTSKDKNAYSYLYRSVQGFPDRDKFAEILVKSGFKQVSYKALTFGICMIYLAEK